MKKLILFIMCLLFALSSADALSIDTSSLNDSYEDFFESRSKLISNEKYPGLYVALNVWMSLNTATVSPPRMTITDDTVGHNVNLKYNFEDIDVFEITVSRPPKGYLRYSFSMALDTKEIELSHLWRLMQALSPRTADLPDIYKKLIETKTIEPSGVITYLITTEHYSVQYRIEPLESDMIFLHIVSVDE